MSDYANRTLTRKVIRPSNIAPPVAPYSPGILVDGTLYLSGQVGNDPSGKLREGIEAQTEEALNKIGVLLKEAGADYSNVVKATCFLSDMANFQAFNQVYSRYFKENPPARSTFAVAGLPLGALVEIEVIAVLGKISHD